MTHSPEFTSWVAAHKVELEADYAYEERELKRKKDEARHHRSLAANLDAESEIHVDNMHRLTAQITELQEALS